MKFLAKAFGVVVLALFVLAAAAWLYLHQSLPQLEGEAIAKGLGAAVEVVRDKEGVPHIFAKDEADAWFAVGYVHAQDRLWQMEFQRRVARGRLSEFIGERAFDTDRLMRTLGLGRAADRAVTLTDPQTRKLLEAYAAGVNAFLASEPVLPVEFQVFAIAPEPWKPADSVAWMYVMAWDLSGNWRSELGRMRYAAKLGGDRANELIPPYPGEIAAPLPDFKQLYAEMVPAARALLALTPGSDDSIGSNSWVVSGERSETGKPILANDPHLGLQTPALWYLAHVSWPSSNVVGGTLPGLPLVVLGRNDNIAWSMTTTNSDTQDLFVEKVAPGKAESYVTPTGIEPFEVREEVIGVRGTERRVKIRSTRHGPVLSDGVKSVADAAPAGHVLALAWAALHESNAASRAGFAMNRARNRDEFLSALREFHAPHQNIVFADREGHIGFIAPALVPLRRADNEAMGRVPVPGWIAKYDWEGFLAHERMPSVYDPASGRIVTANHKITPPGYKYFLGVDWFMPWRADRIDELLLEQPKHSLKSFARIQADTVSRLARELLPNATQAKPSTDEGRAAQKLLAGWKGDMSIESAAPLVFMAWYRELTRLVYADELGDMFKDSWDQRAGFMVPVMKAERGYERWCDDVRTPVKETCAELASKAFDLAAVDLRKREGEASRWRWGELHRANGEHRPFGFFPVVKDFFSIDPQTPGDSFTVNVGGMTIRDEARPFANRHAASLRAIYDLADLDRSLYMHSTGQSGNVVSPWYSSFAERWAKVEYITIPTRREAIVAAHTLKLMP